MKIATRAQELTVDHFRMTAAYYGAHAAQAERDGQHELAEYFKSMAAAYLAQYLALSRLTSVRA